MAVINFDDVREVIARYNGTMSVAEHAKMWDELKPLGIYGIGWLMKDTVAADGTERKTAFLQDGFGNELDKLLVMNTYEYNNGQCEYNWYIA